MASVEEGTEKGASSSGGSGGGSGGRSSSGGSSGGSGSGCGSSGSGSSGAGVEPSEDPNYPDGTVYFCFEEHMLDSTIVYSIKAIRLRDLLSSKSPSTKILRLVACISGKRLPTFMGCGVYRSSIVLAGGVTGKLDPIIGPVRPYPSRDVFVFAPDSDTILPERTETLRFSFTKRNYTYEDPEEYTDEIESTVDPNGTITISGYMAHNLGRLRAGKSNPILVEVHGDLYALASHPKSYALQPITPSFEVYNLRRRRWLPLPEPPAFSHYIARKDLEDHGAFLFPTTLVGTKIFSSSWDSINPYCFDLEDPKKGWEKCKKSNGCWRDMPEKFSPKSLAVKDEDGDWVIFEYDEIKKAIQVYLMSSDYESLLHMKYRVKLALGDFNPSAYQFIDVGGQTVCLVLFMFSGPYSSCYVSTTADTMKLINIPFEFKVFEKKVNVKILVDNYPVLEHHTIPTKLQSRTIESAMLGAFLLHDDHFEASSSAI